VGAMVTLDNFPHEDILTGKEARLAFLIHRYSILANPLVKCQQSGQLMLHYKEMYS